MATKNAAAKPVTADTLVTATLSSVEAGLLLPLAAQAARKGKAEIDKGKARGASALAVMIAGLASDEAASRPWSFDITVKGDVHHHVETIGYADKGNETASWALNGEGKVSRDAQTAYKTAFQAEFFNLPESVPAVWTMAGKAIDAARAIRAEGMTATIESGKLVLSGGKGKRADAMRAAKSIDALRKAAEGATGTNRDAPQNAKGATGAGDAAGDDKAVTPLELTRTTLALAKLIAKGDAATCNAALENFRAIAALVDKHKAVFAGD